MDRRALHSTFGLLLSLSHLGCSGLNGGGGATCANATMNEQAFVLTQLDFARKDMSGHSVGFDLDQQSPTAGNAGNAASCGKTDFTAPDGTTGIDNAFANALPVIDAVAPDTIDADVQDAINSGGLLVGVDLSGYSDLQNSSCAAMGVYRLTGVPIVGTDSIIAANQTFQVDSQYAASQTEATIKSGVLNATPFELELPIRVQDVTLTLPVQNAHVRFDLSDSSNITGLLGGTVKVQDVIDRVHIGSSIQQELPLLLQGIADQDPDPSTGMCRQFSVALIARAKPAFINK